VWSTLPSDPRPMTSSGCQHETICIDGHRLLCSPRLDGVSQRNVGTEVIGSHRLVRHGRGVSVALEMIQKSSALVPSVVSLHALIVIEHRECECELFREVARRVRKGGNASTMSGRRTTFVCDKTHSIAIALTRRQHWGVPCTQKQRASKAKSSVTTSHSQTLMCINGDGD
jgi:hypothetical protein